METWSLRESRRPTDVRLLYFLWCFVIFPALRFFCRFTWPLLRPQEPAAPRAAKLPSLHRRAAARSPIATVFAFRMRSGLRSADDADQPYRASHGRLPCSAS